jgi:hypothetical protein
MNFCEVDQINPPCVMITGYEILLTLGAAVSSLLAFGMLIN